MKKKIEKFLEEATSQVEKFNTDLLAKKEQLQESASKVRRIMRDGHSTDKIRQKQQMTEELQERIDVDFSSCELASNSTLLVTGKNLLK